MKNLSLLPQIIQNLEQHQNSLKLKKLLFYICNQVWENDQTKIDNADWEKLLQELINKKPIFVSLNKYIYGMAKTTTKPKQYSLLADILVEQLEKIYFIEEDKTQACLSKFHEDLTPQEMSNQSEVIKPYDPYKIRAEISANINPLRAKILLFSALYERFNFSSQDWASLKTQQLDELLQNLVDSYPTFTELVSKLEITASIMQEIDENLKVARVISQSLKPFYPAVFI
ncbi:hypothetical protein [Synechocystis sp. PCC 7509]|uniref:hypothetical protein n=1 Tax=Synechocystis sp. PCC 7509 TaxID=927677 RepID=UPI0002AC866B|nr:hypothetical protein [Synechocystis sp. PCC 7509]